MQNRTLSRLLVELHASLPATRQEAAYAISRRLSIKRRLPRRQRTRALAALAVGARQDPDAGVRFECVHAFMWNDGLAGVTKILIASAAEDPDASVRGQALETLANRWALAGRGQSFAPVAEAVNKGLHSTDSVVRFWAVYAAGQLDLHQHRERLEAMVDDPAVGFADLTVGEEARVALANLDGIELIEEW